MSYVALQMRIGTRVNLAQKQAGRPELVLVSIGIGIIRRWSQLGEGR